jgi:hypothetical protein
VRERKSQNQNEKGEKQKMKKFLALIAVLALALAPVAFATDETELTPNGVSQGTLVRALYRTQVLVNELAADHDADNATVAELVADHDADNDEFALAVTELTELKADHDADNNVMDDLKTLANGLRTYLNDGALAHGTLLISGTLPEDFKTTTTAIYTISGVAYAKAAEDDLDFSAADTVNTGAAAGTFWGVWLVQVNAAGVISTKSPAADQVYTSEALAIAALPAADALNVGIGYITVNSNDTDEWIANTDDLTPTSDCLDANFYNVTVKTIPAAVASSPASDLTAANPTGFAANLAATSVAADLTADSVLGSGTVADPKVSLTD